MSPGQARRRAVTWTASGAVIVVVNVTLIASGHPPQWLAGLLAAAGLFTVLVGACRLRAAKAGRP